MDLLSQTCEDQPKQAFDSELAPEALLVTVPSSREILSFTSQICQLLNTYGVVIVEFEENEPPHEQLLCFKEIFGEIMSHDRSDVQGIAEVAVIDETSPYPGISSRAYTFHTDGSYDENPPRIVALRCQTPAESGGITQLASGKKLHELLMSSDKEALAALYKENALSITRAGKSFSGAVFKKFSENRVAIRYRTDDAASASENKDIQKGFHLLANFLSDKRNLVSFNLKSKQVLITDNLTVLHARTAFEAGSGRKMHRLWFNGLPLEKGNLCCGFSENNLNV
ncbi:MAG: hypothetical protein JWN64_169 [Parcubacteria group bacterium]|nr:hypothetical protein [Parcubacteria group bacterium]